MDKEPQDHGESVFELLDDEDKPPLSPKWKGKRKQVDFDKMYALDYMCMIRKFSFLDNFSKFLTFESGSGSAPS